MNIRTIVNESSRGCGQRKSGGLYLVSDGLMLPCGRLPLPLTACPVCHGGIHPSRAYTWINPRELFASKSCDYRTCYLCPVSAPPERAGLIWVGEKYYPTPRDFIAEAAVQGVSRRVTTVPKGFRIGEDWIYVAHRKAIINGGEPKPGVFHAFRPNRIEYILKGDEPIEQLERLEKRGITLVKLERTEGAPVTVEEIQAEA